MALRFARQVDKLLAVRGSSESAFADGSLRRSDVDHIYESTFLDLVSYFEVFVEDLFFICVLGRSAIGDVEPTVTFPTRRLAAVLSSAERGYTSWSKMQEVLVRAEIYLKDGRPFSRLRGRGRDLEVLSSGLKIRNAIAHRSEHAKTQFLMLPEKTLPPSRRTPAGYLQQLVGATSRHETYATAYARIANALTAPRQRLAERFLQAESAFDSGQKAPLGEYVCLQCGTATRSAGVQRKLPSCGTCGIPCGTCGRRAISHFQRVS